MNSSKTVNEMYAASLERMNKMLVEWPSTKKASEPRAAVCSMCGDWVSMTDAVSMPSGKTVCLACQDERRMDVNSGPFNALNDYERHLVGEVRRSEEIASWECRDCEDYYRAHPNDVPEGGTPCSLCGSLNTYKSYAGSHETDPLIHYDDTADIIRRVPQQYRSKYDEDREPVSESLNEYSPHFGQRGPAEIGYTCDDCGVACDIDDLTEIGPDHFVCSICYDDRYKHLPMGGGNVCEGGSAGCNICGNSCYGAEDLCYDCKYNQLDDYEECGYCGFDHSYEPDEARKWHEDNDPENKLYEVFDPGMSYTEHRYDPLCSCPDCAEYEARIHAMASAEEKELRRQKARRLGQEFREADGDAGTQLGGAVKSTLDGKGDASVDPDDPSEALYQLVGSLVTGPAMLTNPATYDRIDALKDTFNKAHPEKKGTIEKLGSLVKSIGSKFGADIRAAKGGELPPSVGRNIQQSFDSYKKMFGKLANESRFVQPTLAEAFSAAWDDDSASQMCKCGCEDLRREEDGTVTCRDCKRNWMPIDEANGKLDPEMYSHIKDRNDDEDDELRPGELSMKSLGGSNVGGHGKADVSGWEDINEAGMMSLDDTCEKCGSSDTERVTTDSEYSGGIERGVHCMECDATTWSDDSAMALTDEAKKLSAKTQKKSAKSFVKGTKKFSDKVLKAKKAGMKNPEGFAAWSMHKAVGKWPSEK